MEAAGATSPALAMAACDAGNVLQHFTHESLKGSSGGKVGHIRDKGGRCLSIKNCQVPP